MIRGVLLNTWSQSPHSEHSWSLIIHFQVTIPKHNKSAWSLTLCCVLLCHNVQGNTEIEPESILVISCGVVCLALQIHELMQSTMCCNEHRALHHNYCDNDAMLPVN